MQEFLDKVYRNFSEFFGGLDTSRKISFVAITAFIITVMTSIIIWAGKTRYGIFYADLNREDSKQIARLLEEKKIAYQLSEDGRTISIPEDMIDQWRLELAMQGVNFSGTVGYEVFDKQPFGTTTFVQKVNKQRALEGELVKTIRYIKGVKRARVHLTIPEQSPFVENKKPPQGSVILELDTGVRLTENEIRGIASLVSASVDGMRPHNVVILDQRGKKLSENIGDPMAGYTANRLALEAKQARQFEAKIEDILGKVVGDGKVIAKVKVNMDFTQSSQTETKFDNENTAVLSEVRNKHKLIGSRPSPQGIPGARSNLPGEKPQPGIPETKNDVDKELTTRNFNVPKKVIKSVNPSAKLKNITAAVMVDGKRVPAVDDEGKPVLGKDGKQILRYEKWTQEEINNFSAIVTSALGLNLQGRDKLTIKNMEFAREDMAKIEAAMKARENRALLKNIVKYLAVGLTISLFFFLVVRPFIQWVTDNTVESVEDFLPKTLEELEKVNANQKLPGLEDALPQIEEKLNPEKIEGNMLREKIVSLVESNPAKAAQIVSELIHSNQGNKEIA